MNYLSENATFTSIEEGKEKLKAAIKIRDAMGGAMYWNILNEDCCEIASKLTSMGAPRKEISEMLGKGTHV